MKPMKDIVKDPKWQAVRESLLGKWNKDPEWCCAQLRKYIEPISKATVTQLRIMMNYLTITPIRMGKIKHPCINKLRAEISMEMKKRKAKGEWIE